MTQPPIYPRTGTYYQAVPLEVDSEEWSGDFQVMLLEHDAAPPEPDDPQFETATELEDTKGIMIAGYDPGTWRVWAHPIGAPPPEDPVVDCGLIIII